MVSSEEGLPLSKAFGGGSMSDTRAWTSLLELVRSALRGQLAWRRTVGLGKSIGMTKIPAAVEEGDTKEFAEIVGILTNTLQHAKTLQTRNAWLFPQAMTAFDFFDCSGVRGVDWVGVMGSEWGC